MAAIFCNNLLTCFPIIFPILLPRFCFLDGPPDGLPCQQQTSFGVSVSVTAAPASNKPYLAHPASLFATAPWLATFSRWRSATAAPLTRRFGQQHFPDGALPRRRLSQGAPPRRPGQQQTSFGREKYSGLASNLAHLGRIC